MDKSSFSKTEQNSNAKMTLL